jgi:cytochrome c-type biogenesis protein CcmH
MKIQHRFIKSLAVLAFSLCLLSGPSMAVMPDEVLKDPALEARARHLSQDLRCLVCQNQSIDDSSAPLARDLRLIVRERISSGDTDEQVMSYLVSRYGNFVLLKPPLQLDTMLLWVGPAIFLIFAVGITGLYFRGRQQADDEVDLPLTEDERLSIDKLVKDS